VQEPVAIVDEDGVIVVCNYKYKPGDKFYTTPPAAKRQWTGLTDAEMYLNCPNWLSHEQCKTWVQQIETKLKEKNP
jgi:hypothetical protein